jgi:hypothetical protein
MAYKNRTPEEIARQIDGLKKMKETLPEFSMFGDSNWEKIDAQLDVLEGKKEADEFYIDETAEEFEEGDNELYFAAQEADDWLNSQHNEDLFG